MKCIQCPEIYSGNGVSLFTAGGISNCPNWQKELGDLIGKELEKLSFEADLTLLNPRRDNFPTNNPAASIEQINWEFNHIRLAKAVSFWFPQETICPISLYELGKVSRMEKKLFVGIHPYYKRRLDVETQTKLERPEVDIVYSLKDLAKQVSDWAK